MLYLKFFHHLFHQIVVDLLQRSLDWIDVYILEMDPPSLLRLRFCVRLVLYSLRHLHNNSDSCKIQLHICSSSSQIPICHMAQVYHLLHVHPYRHGLDPAWNSSTSGVEAADVLDKEAQMHHSYICRLFVLHRCCI